MKCNKYCLFGIIPILYREEYKNLIIWKLLNFIPILTFQKDSKESVTKFLGLPLIKNSAIKFSPTLMYIILSFLALLPTKRNVVLLTDNVREPDNNIVDNFTFFEYLYNSPEQKLKPYYILEKRSSYYKKLKAKYGNRIIGFEKTPTIGFRLKLISLMPYIKYACDSYNALDALNVNLNHAIRQSPYVMSIFTQHGINYFKPKFVRPTVFGFEMYDYASSSNDIETEILMNRGKFPQNRIIKNGLFRWDKLKSLPESPSQKSVFIFFTHREYLKKIKNIADCDYIKEINKILNNAEFLDVLSSQNIILKVGVHHTIAKKIRPLINNKNIELISEDDIAKVKQEASILVTDYSSMCFEFFFQNKPVIFYNINDSADCKLYKKKADVANPYEGKENELFNITKNVDELINRVIYYIKNNYECEKEVLDKESKFFYYKDGFCRRIEDFMITHLNDKKETTD